MWKTARTVPCMEMESALPAILAQATTTAEAAPATQRHLVDVNTLLSRLGYTFEYTPWAGWAVLAGGIFGGLLAGRIGQSILNYLGRRFGSERGDARGVAIQAAAAPASLGLLTVGLSIGLAAIALQPALDPLRTGCITFLATIAITWFLYNLIDLLDIALKRMAARTKSPMDDQIVPLISRTARIFLLVIFVLFVAQNVFGADITAWLAGLGIAGLAVSLAAQDSIKNLFGSITIFLDHAFGVGDRVVFDGQDGMVEQIGFRSTKLRLLDGALVTIPNAKIVDGSVVNIARRPNIRRILNVTITYDTPPAKIEQAIELIRGILKDPEIESVFDLAKFPPIVAFDELNADSLNIKVIYWVHPPDVPKYLAHAQKFNLRLMRAFEEAKIEFAFPTRTLYLAGDPKRRLSLHVDRSGNGQSPADDG